MFDKLGFDYGKDVLDKFVLESSIRSLSNLAVSYTLPLLGREHMEHMKKIKLKYKDSLEKFLIKEFKRKSSLF